MKTKKHYRPSNNPQNINKDSWYYERMNSLELIVWHGPASSDPSHIIIPKKLIIATVKRLGWIRPQGEERA